MGEKKRMFFCQVNTLKWFGVQCDKLKTAAQWSRGQECAWDEEREPAIKLNQLGFCGALATLKCMGREAGMLLLLVEARSHSLVGCFCAVRGLPRTPERKALGFW